MIKITVEGDASEKVGKDLKNFFQTGQRKIVRHYVVAEAAHADHIEPFQPCEIVIIEIKEKKEVK